MDWNEFTELRVVRGRKSKWGDFVRSLKVGEPTKVPATVTEGAPHPDETQRSNAITQVKLQAKRQGRGDVWFAVKEGELWCALPPPDPGPPPKPSADAASVLYCRETGCRGTYVNGRCDECGKPATR
ncbi:MAG: hypothetical protein AB7L91_06365 [Dehalococcoidia bacterium]